MIRAGALADGDIISMGNGFSVPFDAADPVVQDPGDPLDLGPFHFTTPFRLRSIDDRQLTSETPEPIPALPTPVDPLDVRPVFTVIDAGHIQDVIAAARREWLPGDRALPQLSGAGWTSPRPSHRAVRRGSDRRGGRQLDDAILGRADRCPRAGHRRQRHGRTDRPRPAGSAAAASASPALSRRTADCF